MLTKHELKDLASFVLADGYFVNLFLNVDPKDNPKEDWQLHFKNLSRGVLANFNSNHKNIVQGEIKLIEQYLNDRPEGLKRGLAIISSQSENVWRVYHTSVPFKNELIIEHDPYIKPLMTMLDLYQRYIVIVAGQERARIFVAGLGEIEEITEIDKPERNIDVTKDGTSGDMGEIRAQKVKEQDRRMLFKDAITAVEKLIAGEGIKRILLGGTDNARGHFKDLVNNVFRERIVGEFSIDKKAGNKEILEKCTPVMKEVEHGFERRALNELFDKRDFSVLGLSDVLTALQQGNVQKLYVLSDHVQPGMMCSQCGALTPMRERPCPYCNSKMEHVPHMLDLAIQKAIEQGSRVDMLEESDKLEQVGGIAAMLRY